MTEQAITITAVEDLGNDVLRVRGMVGDRTYEATGWVSATTNHFDRDPFDDEGTIRPDVLPRQMTEAEIRTYAERLLREQNPELAPAPRTLLGD